MLPMDFSVFPMIEKDSWKVETDMRSVKWLFVVFYITKIGTQGVHVVSPFDFKDRCML